MLLDWQEPDGSWLAAGQLPGLKWDAKEMNQATTMWTLLALSADPADMKDEALARVRRRALDYLKGSSPGITAE